MNIEELKKQILSEIEAAFEKAFGRKPISIRLEFPPNIALGDFAVSFFSEAKDLKMSPVEIAGRVAREMQQPHPLPHRQTGSPLLKERGILDKAEAVGPYLNLKIRNEILFKTVISEISEKGEEFGNLKIGNGKKVMVEYLSPNTNKPLHLGHFRNGAIGMAVSRILSVGGYTVTKAILVNDRGIHICKSMLAYLKWGEGETPKSTRMKGDHFVGKWYVRYAKELEKNPELASEAEEMLRKWEAGDAQTLKLWKKMNDWVMSGLEESFSAFEFEFDKYYFESKTYKLGKNIIKEGLKKGIFQKSEGESIIFPLPENFGKNKDGSQKVITLIRKDGTSVYLTQDLGTTLKKAEEYDLNEMFWVVGNEQNYHFQVLFEILRQLGYPWAKKCFHLSYAMVSLPDGKMKSREGTVVDADDLLQEVFDLAKAGIKERHSDGELSQKEIESRAKKIALASIKFYLLRVGISQDIRFDPKESISLEGFTGPYCQYAYARIFGILEKVKEKRGLEEVDFSVLKTEEERLILQKLWNFPEICSDAVEEKNPLKISSHIFEIAQAFNQFYAKHPVIAAPDEKVKKARLALIQATAMVIKKGLWMLGIETMERM